MALGVPCIGFDVGGIRDQIGTSGLTLPFDHRLAADADTHLYQTRIPDEIVEFWVKQLSLCFNLRKSTSISPLWHFKRQRDFVPNTPFSIGKTNYQDSRHYDELNVALQMTGMVFAPAVNQSNVSQNRRGKTSPSKTYFFYRHRHKIAITGVHILFRRANNLVYRSANSDRQTTIRE